MQSQLVSLRTVCLVWLASFAAATSAQGAVPADAAPESASVLIRIKNPNATAKKLGDFVDGVQPGFGSFVPASLPMAGQLIGLPQMEGVDLDQDVLLVLFNEPQTDPVGVIIVTAKKVDDVKSALSKNPVEYAVHTVGNMVIYSIDQEAVDVVREQLEGKGKSLWSRIDEASKKTFDAGDLSAIVNVKQLAEDYNNELTAVEPQIDAIVEQMENALPEENQTQMGPILDVYRHIGKSLVAGIRDTNSYAMGVTVTKSAIRHNDRIQMTEGTDTAKFIASQTPAELSLINRLPANKGAYVGFKLNMTSLVDFSMKMTKGMLKDLPADKSAQLDAAIKEMSDLKFGESAMYIDLISESPAMRTGSVTEITPTARMRELSRTITKLSADIKLPSMHQTTKLDTGVSKIGGIEVDRITVKQEIEDGADPIGVQKQLQAILFGEGGIESHLLYQAKQAFQTTGGGIAELQSLVDSLESTKKTPSTITEARQQLVGKSNLIGLFDVAHLALNGLSLAEQQHAFPINLKGIDSLKFEPSYFSYSLTCEPTAVRSQLEIPVAQIQSLVKIGLAIQAAAQQ